MNNTPPFDNDYEKRVQQAYASIGIKQPAKMAAGGVVEDTGGMLNAAARNVKPKLKAEDEAYFNAHNQYATDHAAYSDAYNKWVADWNAGKTEAEYAGIAEPTAPTLPTAQGDLDINAYQAQLAAAAQNKAASRVGGIRAFANPEAYNLAGHAGVSSFEDGGEAVAVQDPRSMDLEQWLLENSRTKAGPVDVQEVRSSRGQGKYDTRVSKDVDGFQAFADVDVGGKKLSQVGASYVGHGRIGNYEVQYVYDPETKQPVITGAIRKELSPTSDVSAEGVYVPQRDGKDYYNAGIKYTKRFRNGGEADKFDAEVLANARLSPDYYAEADEDLIVEKAADKNIKDFDKRISAQARGTNASVDPSRYIRKDTTIFPFANDLNVSGWVDRNKPDQVHIKADPREEYTAFLKRVRAEDPNMQSAFGRISSKKDLDTLVHEMTHSNQVKEAFLPDAEYRRKQLLAARFLKATELKNDMDKEAYLNPMSGSGLSERELGAYLNTYEGLHPSAKTVSGKQGVVPLEKSYLGSQVLPSAKGLLKFIEDAGGFTYFGGVRDPETLKYVNKMMGREKRKPTAAAKPKKFEDGGEVTAADIERVNKESYLAPNGVAPEMGEVKPKYPALNAWSKGLEMAAAPFDKYALDKRIPLVGGMTAADFMGMNDTASLARDVSYGDPVVRGKSLQTSKIDPRLLAVADIVPVAGAAVKGATTLAKAGAKEVARQVETGTGVIGRNTMDPRMYIDAYHGSPKDFDKFDINAPKNTSGGLNKHGIFLSPEKEVGKRYAKDFGKDGVLYKVDADVKKPLNLTATQYEKLQSIVGKLDENKKLNEFEQMSLEDLLGPIGWDMKQHPIEAIKKAGYDSITKSKGKFGVAESEIMVFDPNRLQILDKTPVGTKAEFKMSDLPSRDKPREVYKIPSGTMLYHGAHGDSAKKIVEGGAQLKPNLPYRSSGGSTDEGGLIWLGDKETASYFAESRADPMAVAAEQRRTGQKRKPGQVFAMTTDKPLKLVSRNYVMTQKEAEELNEALGLPEYKHLEKGDALDIASLRAHNHRASNIDRYKVEHVGEISSPWPVILRTIKADGFYDGSGVALSAEALPVAPVKKKHGGEVTDFIKSKK